MVGLSRHYEIMFSAFAYSFMGDYEHDHLFAFQDDVSRFSDDETAREERDILARTRLNGICPDLVEINSMGCLEYIHRSLDDYLQSSEVQKTMSFNLKDFEAPDAISQLVLAHMKNVPLAPDDRCAMVANVLRCRRDNQLEQQPYSFRSQLEKISTPLPWENMNDANFYWEARFYDSSLSSWTVCWNGEILRGEEVRNKTTEFCLSDPLHILTC